MNTATSSPTGGNDGTQQQQPDTTTPQDPRSPHKNAGAKLAFQRDPTIHYILKDLGPDEALLKIEDLILAELDQDSHASIVFDDNTGFIKIWLTLLDQVYVCGDERLTRFVTHMRTFLDKLIEHECYEAKKAMPHLTRGCLNQILRQQHEDYTTPDNKNRDSVSALALLFSPYNSKTNGVCHEALEHHKVVCNEFFVFVIDRNEALITHTYPLIKLLPSALILHLTEFNSGVGELGYPQIKAVYRLLLTRIAQCLLKYRNFNEILTITADLSKKSLTTA